MSTDGAVVVACKCGRAYTDTTWRALPSLGIADGLEFRVCLCGSTITRELARGERPPSV